MITFEFPEKQPAGYIDLNDDFVHWWASAHGKSTSSQHTFNEAAKELYARLFNPQETVEGLYNPDEEESFDTFVVQIDTIY